MTDLNAVFLLSRSQAGVTVDVMIDNRDKYQIRHRFETNRPKTRNSAIRNADRNKNVKHSRHFNFFWRELAVCRMYAHALRQSFFPFDSSLGGKEDKLFENQTLLTFKQRLKYYFHQTAFGLEPNTRIIVTSTI